MSTTETSVALSLAELTRIEEARIEHERSEQARQRSERARAEQAAQERRQADEAARTRAEQEAEARRAREQVAERARIEARERAAADVARIEAEAKARLEADNAVRANQLAELRVRRETGRRRRELALGVAFSLVVALGGLGAWDAKSRLAQSEQTASESRERELSLARERDDAKRVELGTLERRHATLLARARAAEAKQAKQNAEAARAAVDPRAPSHDRLRAFAEALDALDARIDALDELALLEQRAADLTLWARSAKRTRRLAAIESAARAAKAPGASRAALESYSRALGELAGELAEGSGAAPRGGPAVDGTTSTRTCSEGDPGCGLDGHSVF